MIQFYNNMTEITTKDMLGRQQLISVETARNKLLAALQKPETHETAQLHEAMGRITSEAVMAPEDLPPSPRSTMDGYAVKSSDTFGATESMPAYLVIADEVEMGKMAETTVQMGNCFKIPTGGLLPDGADAVVMFEHTIPVDNTMIEVLKSVGPGANIIQRGDDIAKGTQALPAGHKLRAQDIGILAGLGITEVKVHKKINIGVISTGDEIVDYSTNPLPGQIRNINSITLTGLARKLGAEVIDYGIVSDSEEIFFSTVAKAVSENDLVLFSGGSSVGTRDLGEKAIEDLGEPGILVHGVTLKPGKPVIIGLHGNTPIFGLPGHPVSAITCFDLFVAPAIKKISGNSQIFENIPPTVSATLTKNISSAAGRMDIVRVAVTKGLEGYEATPVLGKSGAISTLIKANGFVVIEESSQGISKNSHVTVHINNES